MMEGREPPILPGQIEREQALARVSEFFEKLQDRLHDQETKFDKAVLLVAGGAFIVSLAFVPKLASGIVRPGWLATAWVAWGLCLLLAIGAYLLATKAHRDVIRLLEIGGYDPDQTSSSADTWVQWISYVLYALLVTGFVSFGVFAFSNLEFTRQGGTTRGTSKDTSQADRAEDGGQEIQGLRPEDLGLVGPAPATGVPQAPAPALVTGDSDAEEPIFTTLQASVGSNGVQSFVFVSQWGEDQLTWNCLTDDATRDAFVLNAIGRHLADKQWCLGGWEISKRRVIEAPKPANLYIEGQCK